ncbi:hypothetical protein D3C76_1568790 [compost metagenome]
MLRWIPLRGERQGNGKRSASDAQEDAKQQRLLITVHAQVPGAGQRNDDDHLADQPGGLG